MGVDTSYMSYTAMSERDEMIQIRCTEEEKARWKKIESQVDPIGSQMDSLARFMDAFENNPSQFTPDYR